MKRLVTLNHDVTIPFLLVMALFMPGAFGVANAYGQAVQAAPSAADPSALHAVLTWVGTVLGLVAPAGTVIGSALLYVSRQCATLDDVDVRLKWSGRDIRLTIDDRTRNRVLDGPAE